MAAPRYFDTKWGRLTVTELANITGISRGALCQRLWRTGSLDRSLETTREMHGMSHTRIYGQWATMVQRCTNPKIKCWEYYGGRGITIDPKWMQFANFYRDMGSTWKPGLEIDRIDNNKGYGPGNCKWSTRREQQKNMRNNYILDTPWGRMTLSEASERSGLHRTTIRSRCLAGTDPFR